MSHNEITTTPTLALATAARTLPFHPTPPVVCADLNRQLTVISRHEARRKVILARIDPIGNVFEFGSLPIDFVTGIAQDHNLIHVLGNRGQSYRSLQLEPGGTIVEDILLQTGPGLQLSPRLACGYGTRYYVWIDAQRELQITQDNAVSTLALTDFTQDLVALPTPTGLTLLRNAGLPGYLEFMQWAGGRVQQIQPIEHTEQGYCPLLYWQENHYLLIWISRPTQAIQMQMFDPDLAPLGPIQPLLALKAPRQFRWIRGIQVNHDKILLAWQVERPGRRFSRFGEPLPRLEQHMALLDPMQQQLGSSTTIGYPAESYFVGGWVEDRLILVMGGGQATILLYRLT